MAAFSDLLIEGEDLREALLSLRDLMLLMEPRSAARFVAAFERDEILVLRAPDSPFMTMYRIRGEGGGWGWSVCTHDLFGQVVLLGPDDYSEILRPGWSKPSGSLT